LPVLLRGLFPVFARLPGRRSICFYSSMMSPNELSDVELEACVQ